MSINTADRIRRLRYKKHCLICEIRYNKNMCINQLNKKYEMQK